VAASAGYNLIQKKPPPKSSLVTNPHGVKPAYFCWEASHTTSLAQRLQHMHPPCQVELMRNLHHPNIVKFIEIFDEPAKLYIAMELAPGGWYGVVRWAVQQRVARWVRPGARRRG